MTLGGAISRVIQALFFWLVHICVLWDISLKRVRMIPGQSRAVRWLWATSVSYPVLCTGVVVAFISHGRLISYRHRYTLNRMQTISARNKLVLGSVTFL
jgi:hypothetical protein